jgi:Protein of unknown function (DUF3025)
VAFGLESIDWRAPWLAPLAAIGQPLANQVNAGVGLGVGEGVSVASVFNAYLAAHASTYPLPLEFVPQSHLPEGQAYEAFIWRTGQVPTRDGLHDFFNGLMWLHFPRTKRLLNQWQAASIAASGVQKVRGPLRDALTLFDENVALLACPDAIWDALCERRWRDALVAHRPAWQDSHLFIFGHALLEKLVVPRKNMCAHVLRVSLPWHDLAELDTQLCQTLTEPLLATKPYQPLPVLGVPGWWPANEVTDFYSDSSVFRTATIKT